MNTDSKTTYVEPVGFKGTKGELFISKDRIVVAPNDPMLTENIARSFGDPDKEETKANLDLLCSSKELAKALQDMISVLPEDDDIWEDSAQARQVNEAIANAKEILKQAGIETK